MTSYCVFNVGERRVGIDLTYVREIIEHHLVVPTPIPLTPQFVQGLFNLRGQVLPHIDLSSFVGAQEKSAPTRDDRAVVVERGNLRFATTGQKIDTVEADPSTFTPLESVALHPALDAEAATDHGNFQVIHLDRLEACLCQSLKLTEAPSRTDAAAEDKSANVGETKTTPAEEAKPVTIAPSL